MSDIILEELISQITAVENSGADEETIKKPMRAILRWAIHDMEAERGWEDNLSKLAQRLDKLQQIQHEQQVQAQETRRKMSQIIETCWDLDRRIAAAASQKLSAPVYGKWPESPNTQGSSTKSCTAASTPNSSWLSDGSESRPSNSPSTSSESGTPKPKRVSCYNPLFSKPLIPAFEKPFLTQARLQWEEYLEMRSNGAFVATVTSKHTDETVQHAFATEEEACRWFNLWSYILNKEAKELHKISPLFDKSHFVVTKATLPMNLAIVATANARLKEPGMDYKFALRLSGVKHSSYYEEFPSLSASATQSA